MAIALAGLARALPPSAAYAMASLAGRLVFLLDRRHRRRTIQHILHAGMASTAAEARRLGAANFAHLAKVGVDIMKFDQFVTPETLRDLVTFSGVTPEARRVIDGGGPIIWAAAHFGNWELSGLFSSALVRPLVSVMRPFDNPLIGRWITARRTRFRQEMVEKASAMRPLLRALREGKAVGMLCDQHANSAEGVETIFFGHPARTHASAALLHLKTGAPLMLGLCRRLDDRFHFDFIAVGPFAVEPSGDTREDARRLTQAFTSALEEVIRRHPEQWMWTHRRWLDLNRFWAQARPAAPSGG